MTKKITFSLLAIFISGCVIISVGVIIASIYIIRSQKAYTPPTVEATEVPSVDEQMDKIQEQVAELRGLELSNTLDRAMMTTSELKDVVENDFFADYTEEDAQNDVEILSALGLVNEDFDLLKFYKDLYSEQIAGFYDSETKEMNVIADAGFGGLERMTYAHEFVHVLQDQNYDMENGLKINDDYCETNSEYCAAVTALLEGDATLAEQYWFLTDSTDQDKTDVSDFQASYKSPVYDSAPYYMKQDFLFPYSQGFTFVNALYGKNKWQSVDAAYQNLPVSTEQILHPEKYPDDKPKQVKINDLSGILGDYWNEIDRNSMGEWYSYLILTAGIDSNTWINSATAETATAGWGGDSYVFYRNQESNEYVLFWHSTWDTNTDADEFFDACGEYGNLRWGTRLADAAYTISWDLDSRGKMTLTKDGKEVFWLMSNSMQAYNKALTGIGAIEN